MIRNLPSQIFLLLLLSCAFTFSVQGQPDTIYIDGPTRATSRQSKREIQDRRRYIRQLEDADIDVRQAVLFEPGRLTAIRFPAMTFAYHRYLGRNFSAVGSLGIPINKVDVYQELSGPMSGLEVRLGGKVFLSDRKGLRCYFSLDGWMLNHPVKANAFVREPDLPTFRVRELKLNRKRQMLVPAFGFQSIELNGFIIDLQLGIIAGRRGVFSEDEVTYLSTSDEAFFNTARTDQNQWNFFTDFRIGFSIGYAF